jgi:hypothetical protein
LAARVHALGRIEGCARVASGFGPVFDLIYKGTGEIHIAAKTNRELCGKLGDGVKKAA